MVVVVNILIGFLVRIDKGYCLRLFFFYVIIGVVGFIILNWLWFNCFFGIFFLSMFIVFL